LILACLTLPCGRRRRLWQRVFLTALDERGWSTRDAERATGVAQAKYTRLRRVRLERFTLDRLIGILGKVDTELEVTITVQRRGAVEARAAR
jgi:predicted XRE-type DNA-binding protein